MKLKVMLSNAEYSEVIISGDCNKWMTAMHDEMESLEKNGTWGQEKRNLYRSKTLMRQGILLKKHCL
jgi:L-rhamnose mutarotase